jgi:hypothetical protein
MCTSWPYKWHCVFSNLTLGTVDNIPIWEPLGHSAIYSAKKCILLYVISRIAFSFVQWTSKKLEFLHAYFSK